MVARVRTRYNQLKGAITKLLKCLARLSSQKTEESFTYNVNAVHGSTNFSTIILQADKNVSQKGTRKQYTMLTTIFYFY